MFFLIRLSLQLLLIWHLHSDIIIFTASTFMYSHPCSSAPPPEMYDVSVQTDEAHIASSPLPQPLQPDHHLSIPLLGASQVLDHAASTADANGDASGDASGGHAGIEAATLPAADWHEL